MIQNTLSSVLKCVKLPGGKEHHKVFAITQCLIHSFHCFDWYSIPLRLSTFCLLLLHRSR